MTKSVKEKQASLNQGIPTHQNRNQPAAGHRHSKPSLDQPATRPAAASGAITNGWYFKSASFRVCYKVTDNGHVSRLKGYILIWINLTTNITCKKLPKNVIPLIIYRNINIHVLKALVGVRSRGYEWWPTCTRGLPSHPP